MQSYNPKDWYKPVVYFHKSDTFRTLFWFLVILGTFTWAVAYMELEYLRLSEKSYVRNIPLMHSLLGFAISMLLVFRTNTAYDRWWEGRKLWGQLVNTSRNLAVKVNTFLPKEMEEERIFFRQLLIAFPEALRFHLQQERVRLELDETPHPEIPDFDTMHHVPMRIIDAMTSKVNTLYNEGLFDGHIRQVWDKELTAYLDICGACERIKNTPIPYTYSSFLKKFIVIYSFTLPFGFAFSLGYYAIPVVIFIFYVLASLELIAEEIEEPFGKDANDLPMEQLSTNIGRNIRELLG